MEVGEMKGRLKVDDRVMLKRILGVDCVLAKKGAL